MTTSTSNPAAARTRQVVAAVKAACVGLRMDWDGNHCTVYTPTDAAHAAVADTLSQSGHVTAGREGYEYSRQLGEVRHVYAYLLRSVRVRVVGPARAPAGQFSNLPALERRVTV